MDIKYWNEISNKKEISSFIKKIHGFFKSSFNIDFHINVATLKNEEQILTQIHFRNFKVKEEFYLYVQTSSRTPIVLINEKIGEKYYFTLDDDWAYLDNYPLKKTLTPLLKKYFNGYFESTFFNEIIASANIPKQIEFKKWNFESYNPHSNTSEFILYFTASTIDKYSYEMEVIYCFSPKKYTQFKPSTHQLTSNKKCLSFKEKGSFSYQDLHDILKSELELIEHERGKSIFDTAQISYPNQEKFDEFILNFISEWKRVSLNPLKIETPNVEDIRPNKIYSKNKEISKYLELLNDQIQREEYISLDLNAAWQSKDELIDWEIIEIQKNMLENNLKHKKLLFENLLIYQNDIIKKIIEKEFKEGQIQLIKTNSINNIESHYKTK